MTSKLNYTSDSIDQAWQKAIAQADSIALSDTLWERPQVRGFTIDGPTSKDLDDAIWIEETDTGAIASIHIADVSELVAVDTAIDKVALARAQTRYLSTGIIPMLPYSLSEDKLSLLEGKSRPSLTIQVRLDDHANIINTTIFESWLTSSKQFSYEKADFTCNEPKAGFHKQLKLCQTWAEKLSQQREAQGAFGGLLSKTGILFDENGNVVVSDSKIFHSQIIVQEFMILANRAVAQWFANRDLLVLYRNHTARAIAPERKQLMNALLTTGNPHLIRQKLQNWLNRATYNPTLIGHFALNLPAYCHFTSPIRRLPDLINHRIIKAKIKGKRHPYKHFELEQVCKYIGTVAQAMEQQREAYHKARNQRQYSQQLLNPEALAALPAKEFTNVLRHSLRDERFEPIRENAIARLEQDKLSFQDLFLLLLKIGDSDIQQKVLCVLKNHPRYASSILAIAITQEQTWDKLNYFEGNQNSPFLYWAEVTIGGQSYTTKYPARDLKKQGSRNLACLNWLEAFVNNELVTPEQREISKPPDIKTEDREPNVQPQSTPSHPILRRTLNDGHNIIGLLQQLCQASMWDLPIYEVAEANEGFVCTCQAIAWGQSFKSEAIAPKKKRAKQLAAKDLLEQLQQWAKEH